MLRLTPLALLLSVLALAACGGSDDEDSTSATTATSAEPAEQLRVGLIVDKGQLDDKLTNAIFATPIGKTSEIVEVDGDGSYLFKVFDEETRTPAGRQLEELTSTAFSRWYDGKKSAVVITRDETIAPTNAS